MIPGKTAVKGKTGSSKDGVAAVADAPAAASAAADRRKARREEQKPEPILTLDELPMTATAPLDLFRAKASFKQAISDKMADWAQEGVAGTVTKADTLHEDWEDWKDHESVACLPVLQVVEAARAKADALQRFQLSVLTWTVPVSVAGKRSTFVSLTQELDTALQDLREYQAAIDCLNAQSKGQTKVKKRKERALRDKICAGFVRENSPKVIAKAFIVLHSILV